MKIVEVNPAPEVTYSATAQPVQPPLDHKHTMRQIGVEHHWMSKADLLTGYGITLPEDQDGAYEAVPVMECTDPLCSHQDGRKAEFNPTTQEWTYGEKLEWDDAVHTEYVVIERDENGAHIR